jgi:hypothetical protein
MRISLGDASLWFDVSGPSVVPQGTRRQNARSWWRSMVVPVWIT